MKEPAPAGSPAPVASSTTRGSAPEGCRSGVRATGSFDRHGRKIVLHPADVSGRFQKIRLVAYAILLFIYLVLPFVEVGGYPAIYLDIPGRHFVLFGHLFNARDSFLVFFLLSGGAFALFYVTALFGRVWCGYACPQTVFLEGIFRPIERWIDGPAHARRALDAAPWSAAKARKRILKHGLFAAVSFLMTHCFLAYFVSIRTVWDLMTHRPGEYWGLFVGMMVWTGITYFVFAWFREQVCVIVCPYGRLQSVLTDDHSIVIGYDGTRGEPRGKRRRGEDQGLGDCIDCGRCVEVCPTGIDIREGLQMECIGCANCIDACDAIMDKLAKPRGLIRYDSLEGFSGRVTRFVRGRTVLYSVLLVIGAAVFGGFALSRSPFNVQLIRAGEPYAIVEGQIQNRFRLRVESTFSTPETFVLTAVAGRGAEVIVPPGPQRIEPFGMAEIPVFVRVPRESFAGEFPVEVRVAAGGATRKASAPFLGPWRAR